jgi:hypothetical protein
MLWPSKVRAVPSRWPSSVALAFGIAFAGTLAVALLQGEKQFQGDSAHFWQLGATFDASGHFSLLNFSDSWRGYVLPLIDYALRSLADDLGLTPSAIVKLFNAAIFALIGTVLGPSFIKIVWPEQPAWGLLRRLALSALMVIFWGGFLDFPLSDFPGLAMVLLALIGVSRLDSPGWMLIAGAALGVGLNVRNAYLPFVLAIVALIAWRWFEQRGTPHASAIRRALCVGLLLAGFATVSLPQSLSAHRYHNTWSFVPGASVIEPAGMYFTIGLPVQSYDTYVPHDKPGRAMNYIFPAGLKLLDEQKESRISSTGQFIGLFVTHPVVMLDMLVRHIVNGLDPLYDSAYVENLNSGWHLERRIGGLLIVFVALLRLLWPAARRLFGAGRLRYLLALSVCSLTTLPTQMERRYLLPVYLICYVLALMPGWPSPIGSIESGLRRYRTATVLAVAFVAFAAVVWYITSDAISHLQISA